MLIINSMRTGDNSSADGEAVSKASNKIKVGKPTIFDEQKVSPKNQSFGGVNNKPPGQAQNEVVASQDRSDSNSNEDSASSSNSDLQSMIGRRSYEGVDLMKVREDAIYCLVGNCVLDFKSNAQLEEHLKDRHSLQPFRCHFAGCGVSCEEK